MHYFTRRQHVRLIRGQLVREVAAVVKGLAPFAVFREYADGRRQSRNLYYRGVCGWLYAAPGEADSWGEYAVERWTDFAPENAVCWDRPTEADVRTIAKARPAFRWCLRKAVAAGYSTADLFALLRNFESDPRVELLVPFKELATSSAVRCWTPALVRRLARFMQENGACPVGYALDCVRDGISLDERAEWKARAPWLEYGVYRFLVDHGIDVPEYMEYMATVERAGKDPKDDYWRRPSDFRARRQTVERIVRNQRLAAAREKAAERRRRERALARVADQFGRCVVKGLRVWVPSTYQEIVAQAKALEQCLVDVDYAQRIIDGQCVLVFLAGPSGPVATAELLKRSRGWRVGQFYGDERKKDYLAGPAERSALKAWAKANKLKLAA